MNRRIHPILLFVFVIISALFGLSLHLLGEVTEKTKNEAGFVASSSREQLMSTIKDALTLISPGPTAVIRDIAVSTDNRLVYSVLNDGTMGVYEVYSTDTDPIPTLTLFDSSSIAPITAPKSIAISPDASLAFIAGNDTMLAINTKKLTIYDAINDTSVIKEVYEWKNNFPVASRNYSELEVGPSGKRLYYLVDDSKEASQPYDDSTVFGEIGAYNIEIPMSVVTDSDTTSGFGVLTDSQISLAWKKDLIRPKAELNHLKQGGSDAFIGPFSLEISPDEDFAIVTARGVSGGGLFDPALGRIPPRDETKGGILVVDLQSNPSTNKFGDYIGFFPTLSSGRK